MTRQSLNRQGLWPNVSAVIFDVEGTLVDAVLEVVQQLLPGQLLTRLDDLGNATVLDAQRPLLATLAGDAEANLIPIDSDVASLERCQAIAVVFR